jgi:hypothetical protein
MHAPAAAPQPQPVAPNAAVAASDVSYFFVSLPYGDPRGAVVGRDGLKFLFDKEGKYGRKAHWVKIVKPEYAAKDVSDISAKLTAAKIPFEYSGDQGESLEQDPAPANPFLNGPQDLDDLLQPTGVPADLVAALSQTTLLVDGANANIWKLATVKGFTYKNVKWMTTSTTTDMTSRVTNFIANDAHIDSPAVLESAATMLTVARNIRQPLFENPDGPYHTDAAFDRKATIDAALMGKKLTIAFLERYGYPNAQTVGNENEKKWLLQMISEAK